MIRATGILFTLLLTVSCQDSGFKPVSKEERTSLQQLGDSISSEMQAVLLKNVGEAIQHGGTEFAVEFCNLKAMPLTDSISEKHQVKIQRLSDKNRNPKNSLQLESDRLAWEKIKKEKTDFIEQSRTGEIYYYKPISIGMPSCIQCHGKRSDISEKTLELIGLKYPDDKATGYEMGDLRGMWKISIKK